MLSRSHHVVGRYIRCCSSAPNFILAPTSSSIVSSSNEASWAPEDIVAGLDSYIVGQTEAKKAVAIALRNRWRRMQLDEPLKSEIQAMNILMCGPTGSGKTEIARRLAKMTASPFLKVEATKYTEVGVFGSNTDSIIKDLVEIGLELERSKERAKHADQAHQQALHRIAVELSGVDKSDPKVGWYLNQLDMGSLGEEIVHLAIKPPAVVKPAGFAGGKDDSMSFPPELENLMKDLSNMMPGASKRKDASKLKKQRMTVKDAIPRVQAEELESLVDETTLVARALDAVQANGIVFIDEIDKLVTENGSSGGFKKGEGVQKELLALTEGCNVTTRHGIVNTNHILFIASGAFHRSKPSDLLPELQGRLPIRVGLTPLGESEFVQILTHTQFNLIAQATALLATEGVSLVFQPSSITEIAKLAATVNSQMDDIGARRLATIVSKLTEDVSYDALKLKGTTVEIDAEYVKNKLSEVVTKTDLSRYIL